MKPLHMWLIFAAVIVLLAVFVVTFVSMLARG